MSNLTVKLQCLLVMNKVINIFNKGLCSPRLKARTIFCRVITRNNVELVKTN